ncbi:MAG: aminotransferase class I/II-fold pyridoxal phosphate-dependent enzyme [Planctomycetia bacterium]|nr:aminotransferase class I/II-fold pyridoxal phosphate-dependent enzyme [Planctomycetia bacterium]
MKNPEKKPSGASKRTDRKGTPLSRACARPVLNDFSFDGPPDATVTVGGKSCLYFAGAGYLGLQANPQVLGATCEAVLRYGISPATSRRNYTACPVQEVEQLATHIFQTENAFYSPDEGRLLENMLESLTNSFERIFIDEACSPLFFRSIERVFGASVPVILVAHRDINDLKMKLNKNLQLLERPLFITEGLFPDSGTVAPLDRQMKALAAWDDASILIDDSHAFGVLGKTGGGTLEYFGYSLNEINRTKDDQRESPDFSDSFGFAREFCDSSPATAAQHADKTLPIHTWWTSSLAIAMGGYGGIAPGSDLFVERLTECFRHSGTEQFPTPLAAATATGLSLAFSSGTLRRKLARNVRYLKRELKKFGFAVDTGPSPVISLRLGSSQNMRRIQQRLAREQILISYIPRQRSLGSEGVLRIALFATHTKSMIEVLLAALGRVIL